MMDHFETLAKLILAHKDKYNEVKRTYRQMRNIEKLPWKREVIHRVSTHSRKYSNPNYIYIHGQNHGPIDAASCFKFTNDLADYRKWCRLASKWRRVKQEAYELLCGIRAVGKVCGTKVQTRSKNGMSFNKPFFIDIDGRKITIKEFMRDQMFEQIVLKEDKQ